MSMRLRGGIVGVSGYGGGEALLSYDTKYNQWNIVSWGGGAWSIDGLVEEGVQRDVAVGLLAHMPK